MGAAGKEERRVRQLLSLKFHRDGRLQVVKIQTFSM